MAERIEQGTPKTYRGDNHLELNDDNNCDRSFIEATVNCDRLVVSFRLLPKHIIFDQYIILCLTLVNNNLEQRRGGEQIISPKIFF